MDDEKKSVASTSIQGQTRGSWRFLLSQSYALSFTYSYSLFKHLKCIQFHHLCTQSLLSSSDNLFRRITPDLGSLFPPLPPHSGHSHSDTTTKQGSLEPIHCHYFHFCIISLVNILYYCCSLTITSSQHKRVAPSCDGDWPAVAPGQASSCFSCYSFRWASGAKF